MLFQASALFAEPGSSDRKFKFLFNMGYTWGGEDLGTVQVVGRPNSTETIRSGEGLIFALGTEYLISEDWGVQATVGYHFDSFEASNGELSFERVPLELLGT